MRVLFAELATVVLSIAVLCTTVSVQASPAIDPPWIGHFVAEKVTVASSPDNSFKLIKKFFESAKKSIHISVYQMENDYIADVLEEALDRGVTVRILFEGAPVGAFPQAELYIAKRLIKKGAKILFYHDPQGRLDRTFKFFHAKYSIVDGVRVIVGSANYGNKGHPVERSLGNREWTVVIEDAKAAKMFDSAFMHDARLKEEWTKYGSSERYTLKDPNYKPDRDRHAGKYNLNLEPTDVFNVPVQTVFAPDNSLAKKNSILDMLEKAESSVDVEQLNFETYWGAKLVRVARPSGGFDTRESPATPSELMERIVKLAKAGRKIRVLLNDDNIFRQPKVIEPNPMTEGMWFDLFADGKPPRDNQATLEYLNKLAHKQNLELEARLLDFKNCGLAVLHNKGMIVDDRITLVGSLNWGESALKYNREAGVLLASTQVAGYYKRAFNYDWACSKR